MGHSRAPRGTARACRVAARRRSIGTDPLRPPRGRSAPHGRLGLVYWRSERQLGLQHGRREGSGAPSRCGDYGGLADRREWRRRRRRCRRADEHQEHQEHQEVAGTPGGRSGWPSTAIQKRLPSLCFSVSGEAQQVGRDARFVRTDVADWWTSRSQTQTLSDSLFSTLSTLDRIDLGLPRDLRALGSRALGSMSRWGLARTLGRWALK